MWGCPSNDWVKRCRTSGAGALALFGILACPPAYAEPERPQAEFFTGFEASDNYASGYVGGGYAFGKGLYEESFRLRAVGSFGRYHYDGSLQVDNVWTPITFDGDASFAAALIGYEFHRGRLITKLFAGIEAVDQHITPFDPNNAVQGSELGARFLAENWIDLSPVLYLSVDAAYGTAFQDYWSRARLGYRLRPKLSAGLEGGALGNEEYSAGRAGSFVRFDLLDTELTLAGGFTGNYLLDDPSGYVSLAVHRAF